MRPGDERIESCQARQKRMRSLAGKTHDPAAAILGTGATAALTELVTASESRLLTASESRLVTASESKLG
jgi:hypothetical protein